MSNIYEDGDRDKFYQDIVFESVDGTIINTAQLTFLVICEKCNHEIEEEGIVKNRALYHYNCSGIEL